MQVKDLKQRQMVKDNRTGIVYRVSKRWNGTYLVNPATGAGYCYFLKTELAKEIDYSPT